MSNVTENTLYFLDNYGPLAGIATSKDFVLDTRLITRANWESYHDSVLNILRDGIYTDYVQKYMVKILFSDGNDIELSIMDMYTNIIMWRLIVFSGMPIMSYHILFDEELTANSIKDYIDNHFINPNRTALGNKELSNIICDTVHCFHHINEFAPYLGNTLNLEDTVELMNEDEEFYECLHTSFAGLAFDEIKDKALKQAAKSIDRIKKSKPILGHDHCLADAWRAKEGINIMQYAEFSIGIGIKPDGRGGIFNHVINSSFINGGLTSPEDYFVESAVARLSQIIKFKSVSSSGAFARIMGLNNMDSSLYPDPNYDCGSKHLVPVIVRSDRHLRFLSLRYYRELPSTHEKCINYFTDKHLIGKTIYLRDPCTCTSAARGHGVCYKCYGDLAYSVYDSEEKMGVNIGRIASELITAKQTQKQLSIKHILDAKVEKVTWSPEFYSLFIMNEDIIQIDPELEKLNGYRILIDPDSIELENDGDDGNLDDEDLAAMMYNEYIMDFDVLVVSTGEIIHITNDRDNKLYFTNEFNGIIRKKGEPIEGKISIGMNEIKDNPLFIIRITNNEITQTLNKLKHLYNKSSDVKGRTISSLLQEILDTNISGDMNIAAVHYSIILMNQLRDSEDILSKPNWEYYEPDYRILTLNEALNANPAITISLSYQKIMRMFYNPLTYRKKGSSFMDLFFMEKPQNTLRGIDEAKPIHIPVPGELFEPIIFTDDPDKVTSPDVISDDDDE